jgi:hypothetical protein
VHPLTSARKLFDEVRGEIGEHGRDLIQSLCDLFDFLGPSRTSGFVRPENESYDHAARCESYSGVILRLAEVEKTMRDGWDGAKQPQPRRLTCRAPRPTRRSS